jgi:HEAT repeat protein
VPHLVQVLSDPSAHPKARAEAAVALGEIGDPAAIPAITGALKDEDAGVRRAAVVALAELAGDTHSSRFRHNHPNPTPNPNPNPNPRPNPRPFAGIRQ